MYEKAPKTALDSSNTRVSSGEVGMKQNSNRYLFSVAVLASPSPMPGLEPMTKRLIEEWLPSAELGEERRICAR